nr:hypothetical protein [Dinophyceae sp. MRD-151]
MIKISHTSSNQEKLFFHKGRVLVCFHDRFSKPETRTYSINTVKITIKSYKK